MRGLSQALAVLKGWVFLEMFICIKAGYIEEEKISFLHLLFLEIAMKKTFNFNF